MSGLNHVDRSPLESGVCSHVCPSVSALTVRVMASVACVCVLNCCKSGFFACSKAVFLCLFHTGAF